MKSQPLVAEVNFSSEIVSNHYYPHSKVMELKSIQEPSPSARLHHRDTDIAEPLLPDTSPRGELEEKDASREEAEPEESVLVSETINCLSRSCTGQSSSRDVFM